MVPNKVTGECTCIWVMICAPNHSHVYSYIKVRNETVCQYSKIFPAVSFDIRDAQSENVVLGTKYSVLRFTSYFLIHGKWSQSSFSLHNIRKSFQAQTQLTAWPL